MASFHFASLLHLPTTEVRQPQVWQRLRQWLAFTSKLFTPEQLAPYGLQNTAAEVSGQLPLCVPRSGSCKSCPAVRKPQCLPLSSVNRSQSEVSCQHAV